MTPAAPRAIIVNADDLGRTPGINRATFDAHARGLVTSATLMVAEAAAADAAARLADHPGLGVGLHVTLTAGAPTLPPDAVPSLVDAAGRLPRATGALAGADAAELLAEMRSQLARFEALTGRTPTHLDTHHHAHRVPVVLEALITLAADRGLPVRCASPEVHARLRAAGVATTDAFVERFYGADATLAVLVEILEGVGAGVTEIMCHPGVAGDPDLSGTSAYRDERARETAVLTSPEAGRACERLGLVRRHFGGLCAS